jgi:hypothetical protein
MFCRLTGKIATPRKTIFEQGEADFQGVAISYVTLQNI